jgi:hypothetical protein
MRFQLRSFLRALSLYKRNWRRNPPRNRVLSAPRVRGLLSAVKRSPGLRKSTYFVFLTTVMTAHDGSQPYTSMAMPFNALGDAERWVAPALQRWLHESLERASRRVFGREVVHVGCGGTLPLFSMLGARFPHAQFFMTGVLGPNSNAHGPNEFLDLTYVRRITECVALVLADHGAHVAATYDGHTSTTASTAARRLR